MCIDEFWPCVEGRYLTAFLTELAKRRKAIHYYGSLELAAGIDRHKLSIEESIEIMYTPQSISVLRLDVRIVICEDGESQLQIRRTSKKRAGSPLLSVRNEGRCASPIRLVAEVEWVISSLSSIFPSSSSGACDQKLLDEMKRRWMSLLE